VGNKKNFSACLFELYTEELLSQERHRRMAFFKGRETFSLDSKNRIFIPKKMLIQISPEAEGILVITLGFDRCIYAYPKDEWQYYEELFRQKDQFNGKDRFFLRSLLMWAEEVKLDAQGRITLPKDLKKESGITEKVDILGQADHIEFWDPIVFDKYRSSRDESYEEIAASVMGKQRQTEKMKNYYG